MIFLIYFLREVGTNETIVINSYDFIGDIGDTVELFEKQYVIEDYTTDELDEDGCDPEII